MNKKLKTIYFVVLFLFSYAQAENIDPCDGNWQYAYGENVGWVNFEPNLAMPFVGATVSDSNVTGFVWAENIGWINLDPNYADPNVGIKNDGTGLLTGFAWGENVGWINFSPDVAGDANYYGVTIDSQGDFNGWAWGENIGWIHFQAAAPVTYKTQTSWVTSCKVGFDDLGRFAQNWLETQGDLPADLDKSGDVDFLDYAELADLWQELCTPGWPLK